MTKPVKIVSIIITILFIAFYTFLQIIFGMVNNVDRTTSNVNIIVAIEWGLFAVLISYLIYIGYNKKIVTFYYSFIIANIFFMLAMCLKFPIFLRNIGFHHSEYRPTLNPLVVNSILYIAFLIYINFKFKQKKIINIKLSRLVYIFTIIAILTIIYVKKISEPEIQKILHFQG
jgi:hypothetical protein